MALLRLLVFLGAALLSFICIATLGASILIMSDGVSVGPMVLAVTSATLAILFGIPKARHLFTRATTMIVFRLLAAVGVFYYFGQSMLTFTALTLQDTPLSGRATPEQLQTAMLVSMAVYVVTFLMPGLSHILLKKEAEKAWFDQQQALGLSPAPRQRRWSLANALPWVMGLLMVSPIMLGILFPTLPNPDHAAWVDQNALLLYAGAIGIAVVMCLLHQGSTPGAKLVGALLLGGFFVAVAHDGMRYGLPAAMSLVGAGTSKTIEVSVLERGQRSQRRSCDRNAIVEWNGSSSKLCDIPIGIWEDLRAGQTLRLSGDENRFGLRYYGIDTADS